MIIRVLSLFTNTKSLPPVISRMPNTAGKGRRSSESHRFAFTGVGLMHKGDV